MTLKQFFQIGGGVAIGLFFYATKLPFFFKWPLIALSVGLGAGMAFMPVEGRPLDQWLLAFIKSIYSPTIYIWKPSAEEVAKTPVASPTPQIKPLIKPTTPSPTPVSLSTPAPTPAPRPASSVVATPHKVVAPKLPEIRVTPPPTPAPASPTVTPAANTGIALPNFSPKPNGGGTQPVFSSTLPIPSTPQTPNTIVGMTLTPDGHILEGAIVEVKLQGSTVRATKSNKLGQFLFVQPLNNNIFQITAEKAGYRFPVFALNLTGQVVQPLKLQALATTGSVPQVNPYSANQTAIYA